MSIPYFPMYPDDFDADTAHLSLAEDGAYNRLMRLQWRQPGCKFPAEMPWIMRKMRAATDADRDVVASVLGEFFTRKGGKIFSERLLKEWVKANDAHAKRISAGSKGGTAKARKTKGTKPSNAVAMTYQPEPEPEPEKREGKPSLALSPKPTRFDEFWQAYPHRGGVKRGRKPAEARYVSAIKAGASEQDIIDGAKRAGMDRRVRDGFARDPTTWLNQDGWTDEIDASRENQNGNGHRHHAGQAPESRDRFLDEIAEVARARPAPRLVGG